mmetsp:Transcript_16375/g.49174  ORF Transcript_16375/g.49174 Transcript_16375/m.49174 type:complete len:113 (+) Transcript_16375:116-454(+)
MQVRNRNISRPERVFGSTFSLPSGVFHCLCLVGAIRLSGVFVMSSSGLRRRSSPSLLPRKIAKLPPVGERKLVSSTFIPSDRVLTHTHTHTLSLSLSLYRGLNGQLPLVHSH